MTDKQHNKIVKKLRKSVEFWLHVLGLGHQRKVSIYYLRDEAQMPSDGEVCARTSSDWEYKHASVTFYTPRLGDCTDEDLDYFVRHELAHILVNPMNHPKQVKEEELVVTTLAQCFDWIYSAGKGTLEANYKKVKK